MHDLLKHGVVVFSVENADDHQWVSDLSILYHKALELATELFPVCLTTELNSERLFNFKLKLI